MQGHLVWSRNSSWYFLTIFRRSFLVNHSADSLVTKFKTRLLASYPDGLPWVLNKFKSVVYANDTMNKETMDDKRPASLAVATSQVKANQCRNSIIPQQLISKTPNYRSRW